MFESRGGEHQRGYLEDSQIPDLVASGETLVLSIGGRRGNSRIALGAKANAFGNKVRQTKKNGGMCGIDGTGAANEGATHSGL